MHCCLSGRPVPPRAELNGLFHAAHVYPTAWRERVRLSFLYRIREIELT